MKYIISKDDTEIIHITNIEQFTKFEIVPLLKTQVTTGVEGPDTYGIRETRKFNNKYEHLSLKILISAVLIDF